MSNDDKRFLIDQLGQAIDAIKSGNTAGAQQAVNNMLSESTDPTGDAQAIFDAMNRNK